MDVKTVLISPDIAAKWLKTSNGNPRWPSGNRIVDKSRVKIIAEDIKNGRWVPSNNSIAFDSNGNLVDGHHRLSAIVLSGKSVLSIVVRGIEDEALLHVDENRSRSISQRTGIDSRTVGAINCHFCMLRHSIAVRSESSETINNFAKSHPSIFKARELSRKGNNHTLGEKSSVVHALMCALDYGVSEEYLRSFILSVNTGFVDDSSESAAIVTRNMLINSKLMRSRSTSIDISRIVQASISDYVSGTPRKKSYKNPVRVYFDLLEQSKSSGYVIYEL